MRRDGWPRASSTATEGTPATPLHPVSQAALLATPADPEAQAAFAASIPHVRQLRNWDCGLACAAGALAAAGAGGGGRVPGAPPLPAGAEALLPRLAEATGTSSVWTVDLAHALCSLGARVRFSTTQAGARDEYSKEDFYAAEFGSDAPRVTERFRGAAAAGILVEEGSVPASDLLRLVQSARFVVIVLLDRNTLDRRDAWGAGVAAPPGDTLPTEIPPTARGYAGHYVIVARASGPPLLPRGTCGPVPSDARAPPPDALPSPSLWYELRDPAWPAQSRLVPASALEAARRAFGTDEDLLLVEVLSPTGRPAGP